MLREWGREDGGKGLTEIEHASQCIIIAPESEEARLEEVGASEAPGRTQELQDPPTSRSLLLSSSSLSTPASLRIVLLQFLR